MIKVIDSTLEFFTDIPLPKNRMFLEMTQLFYSKSNLNCSISRFSRNNSKNEFEMKGNAINFVEKMWLP